MIGNSPKVFPFRSKTVYERCFLACICWYGNVRFSAISIAYGRFMFACWQTYGYFNIVSNIVNKKTVKKHFFLAALFHSEIRTLSPIISLKRAEFFWLTPACGCAGAHPLATNYWFSNRILQRITFFLSNFNVSVGSLKKWGKKHVYNSNQLFYVAEYLASQTSRPVIGSLICVIACSWTTCHHTCILLNFHLC